jgi:hypothetical protein
MRFRRRASLAAVAALLTAPGCGDAGDSESGSPGTRPFAAGGVWNRPLPRDAPAHPRSAELVSELRRQLGKAKPWINTHTFSTPVYEVGRRQRRVRVTLDTEYPALAQAFRAVPLPRDARPAKGADAHLVLRQRSTDTIWEFFKLRRAGDGWHARWGARMRNASRNRGVFPFPLGATATGLPLLGGLIRPGEMRRGRIDHALAFAIPEARAGTVADPATRTDGQVGSERAIPLGTRFRLDPGLDLSALPRPTRVIARAVQRYGMIARDKSGGFVFYGEAAKPGERDPWPRLFGGRYPSELLEAFPWDRLEAVAAPVRRAKR